MKLNKLFFTLLIGLSFLACQQPQQTANTGNSGEGLTQVAFNTAMDKFLSSDKGQEKLGNTIQEYFKRQQEKAQEDQQKQEEKALEDQFKNPVKVEAGDSPVKGPADAKVTIVEFSDFECPFCQRGANTIEEVLKAYPNDVKVIFKNLPLPFHQNAKPAALAALAAGKQGKFWEMHDVLFQNQRNLGEEFYLQTAKDLGLDIEKFKKDLADESLAKQIEADEAQARKLGITGTPGFSVNGVMVRGAYPFNHFKQIIDRWLEQ